jgi:hypothetical protein
VFTRASGTSPTSESARHTVDVEATGPVTGPRWRKPWKSLIASPPRTWVTGHVEQDLTSVIDRVEPPPRHRRRQPSAQPAPLGQQPDRQRPGEPDQPIIIADEFQPVGP